MAFSERGQPDDALEVTRQLRLVETCIFFPADAVNSPQRARKMWPHRCPGAEADGKKSPKTPSEEAAMATAPEAFAARFRSRPGGTENHGCGSLTCVPRLRRRLDRGLGVTPAASLVLRRPT